jgi:thiol-disulfide isomerase/thioredoxin
MIFITKEEDININLKLQSLYFYASWMPLHKKLLTMISSIEENYGMAFYAIDVDYFENQCKRFSITSIPTILVLAQGSEIKRINGFVSTPVLTGIFVDIYGYKGEENDKEN